MAARKKKARGRVSKETASIPVMMRSSPDHVDLCDELRRQTIGEHSRASMFRLALREFAKMQRKKGKFKPTTRRMVKEMER